MLEHCDQLLIIWMLLVLLWFHCMVFFDSFWELCMEFIKLVRVVMPVFTMVTFNVIFFFFSFDLFSFILRWSTGKQVGWIVYSIVLFVHESMGHLFLVICWEWMSGKVGFQQISFLWNQALQLCIQCSVSICGTIPTKGHNFVFWQVSGSSESVQDALFHITSRLREIILPTGPHSSVVAGAAPEIPPVIFRPRHEQISPGHGHYSSVGLPHGLDRSASFPQVIDRKPVPSQSMDHLGHMNVDLVPHPYRVEVSGHVHAFDRPSSPRSWPPQVGET